jgi:hypothetical protein
VLAVLAAYYVFAKYAKVWEATGFGKRAPRG